MKCTGTVKWFDLTKGYGFISPDNGQKDVFIHKTALQNANINNLQENQKIEYEIIEKNGKTSAENIKLLGN